MRKYYLYKIKDKDSYILSLNKKRKSSSGYTFRNFIRTDGTKLGEPPINLGAFNSLQQLAGLVSECVSISRFYPYNDSNDGCRTYSDIELLLEVEKPIEIYDYIRENFPEELI